jgi:hypothetical protein
MLLNALLGIALADEPATADPPPPPPPTGDAEAVPDLSDADRRFLKPKHARLPPNPYAQTDFTAYTLEWGEFRLGFGTIQAGVLPRTQLGTVPILDLLGLYNLNAKVDPLRLGPVDLGADLVYYVLPLGHFVGTYKAAGVTLSVVITPGWSIHGGIKYGRIQAHGIPDDLSGLPGVLATQSGFDTYTYDGPTDPKADLEAGQIDFATDLRLNRRDSFVFRFLTTPYAHATSDFGGDPPPILGVDRILEAGGDQSVASTWSASLSYQATFKHWDVRLGGGWSAIPFQWVLQAEDVAYRFGGKTRTTERKARKGWRDDKHADPETTMPVEVPAE